MDLLVLGEFLLDVPIFNVHSPSLLIIVPTLDSYTLLSRLVHSLQQQTWPHWRLLFIDGPSSSNHRNWLLDCCNDDSRCHFVEQQPEHDGIFGAMNQGFSMAAPEDWLLFWGSDDWAAAPNVFESVVRAIVAGDCMFDLLVCKGRYVDVVTSALGRISLFQPNGLLHSAEYRRALLFGSTPPHQATLFGPSARLKLDSYAPGFRLSADLDYFLRLSRNPDLCVLCLDLELVHMSDGGVSGQQTQRRLLEVRHAYQRVYSLFWWFPFLARYVRRLLSLVPLLG